MKEKKVVWDKWKAGGHSISGELYDKKCAMKKTVKQRLSLCAASVPEEENLGSG